jgi:hypothetical protein
VSKNVYVSGRHRRAVVRYYGGIYGAPPTLEATDPELIESIRNTGRIGCGSLCTEIGPDAYGAPTFGMRKAEVRSRSAVRSKSAFFNDEMLDHWRAKWAAEDLTIAEFEANLKAAREKAAEVARQENEALRENEVYLAQQGVKQSDFERQRASDAREFDRRYARRSHTYLRTKRNGKTIRIYGVPKGIEYLSMPAYMDVARADLGEACDRPVSGYLFQTCHKFREVKDVPLTMGIVSAIGLATGESPGLILTLLTAGVVIETPDRFVCQAVREVLEPETV